MSQEEKPSSSAYKHSQKSAQRPDAAFEAQFQNRKAPKTYRYDSSLAPELCWDESAERAFAEWLLRLITEAAEKGESVVFAQPRMWCGSDGHAALYLTLYLVFRDG
jgi:adenine-specific DNA-methyltransferase